MWRQTVLLLSLVALSALNGLAQSATYSYDQLGRLAGVVDQNGNAARYTYDAVGNILSITRYTNAQVALLTFSPSSGPVGTQVILSGSNFSATPSSNAVLFNGKAAVVTAATATSLAVSVPSGATTGVISVTSPVGSTSSTQPFTVTASNGIPAITAYSPSIVAAGAKVTIEGVNFSATPADNRLALNSVVWPIPSTATSAALGEVVPGNLGSGRIAIGTPVGSSTSSVDLYIPPSPYLASQVGFTGRTAVNTKAVVSLPKTGTVGMLLFDSIVGDKISIISSGSNIPSCNYQVYDSSNASLGTSVDCSSGGFLDAQEIAKAGTNTLLVVPQASYGSAYFDIYQFQDVSATATVGGSNIRITTTVPGQNGTITFSASSGQDVIVAVPSATYSSCEMTIYRPDGTTLNSVSCASSYPLSIDLGVLTETGTYEAVIDPQGVDTGSVTFGLLNATAIKGGALSSGVPVTLTTTIPGQDVSFTFTGTSGERISMLGTANYQNGQAATVSINQSTGTSINSFSVYSGSASFLDTTALPAAGTYTVAVTAPVGAVGPITLTLYTVPPDAASTLTVSGAAATVSTTTPGQNGSITFKAAVGQHVLLNETSSTYSSCTLTVKDPNGNYLTSESCASPTATQLDLGALTLAGNYSIVIDPQGASVGSVTLDLVDATTIQDGKETLGTPVTIATTEPDQSGTFTFTGAVNEQISMVASGQYSNRGNATITISNPDQSNLTELYVSNGVESFLDSTVLKQAGTYLVTVTPQSGAVGTTTVTPYVVPATTTASATVGGSAVTLTTTVPGQNASLSFTGTAGQDVIVTTLASNFANCNMSVIDPSSNVLASPSCAYAVAHATDLGTLGETGKYTIDVDPQGLQIGSVEVKLLLSGGASGTTIAAGGVPVALTATTLGQTGTLTFAGTAGQRVDISAYGEYPSGGNSILYLKLPDGSVLSSVSISSASTGELGPATLPTTGTYQIFLEPSSTTKGTTLVSLYQVPADISATVVAGKAVTAVTTEPGQQVVYTYAGTAGTAISIVGTGSYSENSSAIVTIVAPDGSDLGTFSMYSGSSVFFDQTPLPLSGTYRILVQPSAGSSGTTVLTLYAFAPDASATATLGGADTTVAIANPGQNGEIQFSATAGQHIVWYADAATFSNCSMQAFAPDGTYLNQLTCDSTSEALVDLGIQTQTGTYTLFVNPQAADIGSVSTRIANIPAISGGPLSPGVGVSATTTLTGQQSTFTFKGTAGQRISLVSTGAYKNAGFATATINDPFGGQLATFTIYDQSSTFLDSTLLTETGSYTIAVTPNGVTTGTTQITLYDIPAGPSLTATAGTTTVVVTTTVPGQNGSISVPFTAGQHIIWTASGSTYSDCSMSLYDSNFNYVNGLTCDSSQPTFIDLGVIASSGQYSIIVDPQGSDTGSITVGLLNAATTEGGALTSGVQVNATNTVQNGETKYTIAGTAGETISMLASASYINGGYATVNVYDPDGTALASFSVSDGSSQFLSVTVLPVTGTYTVVVYPQGSTTGTTTLTFYKVPANAAATTTVGGKQVSVTTTVPGQNGQVNFPGQAGQLVSIVLSGAYALNGTTYGSIALSGGQSLGDFSLSNESTTTVGPIALPSTGTYQILISPRQATIGATTVSVTAN